VEDNQSPYASEGSRPLLIPRQALQDWVTVSSESAVPPSGKAATRRQTTRLLPIALALLLLTGCGETSPDGVSPKVLRIGVQKSGLLTIVRGKGELADRVTPLGWRIEWTEFPAGPPLLEAMNVGSIDFGHCGDSPPIFAQAAGVPFKYVAASEPSPEGNGILVRKDSAIEKIDDLKGKKIAFAKGSSAHHLALAALESVGLSFADVQPVYLIPSDARAALQSHSIDAWVIWDPYLAISQRNDPVRILVDGKGLVSGREFFIASNDLFIQHGDLLPVILDELNKVGQWAAENRRATAEFLSPSLGVDVDTLEFVESRRARHNARGLTPDLINEQQSLADRYLAAGLIHSPLKVASAFALPLTDQPMAKQ
jgi:sulfonate transport system substrate-binding protein